MTKRKTWPYLAHSVDADCLSRETLTDLVVEARDVDWNFVKWCCASGYDANNPIARRMFECLLVAKGEGRVGLH